MYAILVSLLAMSAAAMPLRHDVDENQYRGDPADYPALFGIYRSEAGAPNCLATLIEPQWAVTAAHCTFDAPFVNGVARDSGYPVEIGGRETAIVDVVRHTLADGTEGVDLALLKLVSPVRNVTPERLYLADDELDRTVVLPGWGGTGDGLRGLTGADGVFRVAENRIDAVDEGWLIWRFDDPRSLTHRALALEGVSGPGDSGGPAFIHTPQGRFMVGVSSGQRTYGRPEGVYGAEEYFVRVSWYADWIAEIITAAE